VIIVNSRVSKLHSGVLTDWHKSWKLGHYLPILQTKCVITIQMTYFSIQSKTD